MAATNPLRVSDLIRKYGWEIMVYLSNLGPTVLAEAQVLFVDSGHTNALDADDGEHGHSLIKPLATWDYANGLCTASEACVIFLAPGHNENLGAAQIDLDVIGVHTIGIGSGSLKPRIDFEDVASSIDIGANNVTIQNVDLLPSVPAVLIGVNVETGVTDFKMKDVRFLIGEDGAGADEFVKAVEMTSGNDDCVFEDVVILAHASAGGATHGIHVAASADRTVWRNVVIDGPYATGGIVEAALGVNLILEDCAVDVTGTNYNFDGSSTFAKRVNNVDGQVREDDSESLLVEARGSAAYPSGITNESVWAYLLSASATPAASSYDNETDSLEAIRDAVDAIDNTTNLNTAVPVTPTGGSMQDILSELDGANTYDNTTDSLEAISNFVRTGVTLGRGINLDYFMKTAVADEQDMSAEIATGSALAHILVKAAGGDVDDFDPTTDSLQAIADAVTAISDNVTTAVPSSPTARSLQDIVEKDGSSGFVAATHSLEAIADFQIDADLDKLTSVADGTGNYPASVVQDSVIAMILSKSANPVASSYDNQTDSLEALSNFLVAAISGHSAGSALDILNKIYYAADGAGAFPATLANDSTLAKIMCTGATATPSTFDNTTDSLEAISDFVRTGVTLGRGINLDYLAKTSTGVAADADLTTYAGDQTLLSHIMTAGADTSDYQASTDSLEAIANALAAGTGATAALEAEDLDHLINVAAGTDVYPVPLTTDSIIAMMMCKGAAATASTYNNTTDSQEAIADYLIDAKLSLLTSVADGGGNAYPDTVVQESVVAYILSKSANPVTTSYDNTTDSLEAIADKITAVDDGVNMGTQVVKVTGTILTGGDVNVFTVATGPVKIRSLFFIMDTATDAACKAGFTCTPTAGAETDLTPTDGSGVELNAASDAGDIVYSEMDNTIMIIANTDGGEMPKVPDFSQIVPIGIISLALENAAPGAGSADIYVQWEPLAPGATLTAT